MSDVILAIDAGLLAWAITGLFTLVMVRRQRLVAPNDRGLHSVPVPNGGGIGIVLTVLVLWPLWTWPVPAQYAVLLSGFVALALVSWLDDRLQISPFVSLAVHGLVIGLCVAALPPETRLFRGIPLGLEKGLFALTWLWFTHLYKFMDGVDGLAGSESVFIALGYIAVLSVAGQESALTPLALIVAAASAGYLIWNWHPARVVMGDVGSIALGFLLGWLMIDLALRGHLAAAIILPLYFCADATVARLVGLVRERKLGRSKSGQLYQRALSKGLSQSDIVMRVIAVNCLLLLLALVSVRRPAQALLAALVIVAGLIGYFGGAVLRTGAAPPARQAARTGQA